jgi:CubicO group peptidase (beta-lactamase class C family)
MRVGGIQIERAAKILLVATTIVLVGSTPHSERMPSPPDLPGLWAAKLRFGPDIRGTLRILRVGSEWRADIAGFSVPARFDGQSVSFDLPDGRGGFRGNKTDREIAGHWLQQTTIVAGRVFATPLTLRPDGPSRWRGEVMPLDDTFTFYLPVTRQSDGTLGTYLRNPERNLGRFIPVTRIEGNAGQVRLLGTRRGERTETSFAEGHYDSSNSVISIRINGNTFDFTKDDDKNSPFYPRAKQHRSYTYAAPIRLDDGWRVGTLEEVRISREGIEKLVQMLMDMPMDSVSTSQIHSLLIARHGKLVLEEYFHGYNRDMPHDTRSAAKSWTAVLIGAAMEAGVPIRMNTPVYATMLGSVPSDLDPRKRTMTLEHLLSMTAGYDCDERNPNASGQEDVMQQQTLEPDWYRYTMNVPLVSGPGEKVVYCSAEPNLAAGMLQKIAREPLPELFYRLVGKPLQMRSYHLLLSPTGDAYGGGGHYFLPRDFLKLAQLMVNEGRWGERRILSKHWARTSGAALRDLSPIQQYGYLWNSLEYPYKDRKVHAFFAGGNGGQIFMGIPELDLVIGFTGGNYNDPSLFIPQRVFVPKFILPAVN